MTEIKTCPFCGEVPDIVSVRVDSEGDFCSKIACQNIKCDIQPETVECDTIAEAVRMWNARVGGCND